MAQKQWEQTQPGGETQPIVEDVVEKYLAESAIPAEDSGPGSAATPGQQAASGGDNFDAQAAQIVERVMAQLGSEMDTKLGTMRQDLQTYAERTAQSFSDKTASRLSARQKDQIATVEATLEPLRAQLGPDFDAAMRQAKLNLLISGSPPAEGVQGAVTEPNPPVLGPAPAAQPAATESDDFATVYLSNKLGDPSGWAPEDVAALHADLAQARDWTAWMTVVDGYATRRPVATGARAATRAQPVGAQAGSRPAPSLDRLSAAYNAAAAENDMKAMEKIGLQIDIALAKAR